MKIDQKLITNAKTILRAIDHKERQVLIDLIDAKGQSDVSTLYKELGMEQSVCSQHLAILRKANVLTYEREGKQIFYSVNYERLKNIQNVLSSFN